MATYPLSLPLSPITDAFTPYSPRINGYYHQSLSTPRSLWPITPPHALSRLLTLRHSHYHSLRHSLHHTLPSFSRFHLPFSPIEIAGPSVSLVNHHHHTPIKWPQALQTPAAPVLYGSGSVEQTHPDAAVSTPEPPEPTIASKAARSTQNQPLKQPNTLPPPTATQLHPPIVTHNLPTPSHTRPPRSRSPLPQPPVRRSMQARRNRRTTAVSS